MIPAASDDLAAAILQWAQAEGVDLRALGLGWARMAPVVALVPALGLRGAPQPVRASFGLLLAASVAPGVGAASAEGPWVLAVVTELLRGLPLAVGAALPLWIAVMVGGVIDAVRGASEQVSLPVFDGKLGAFGALWGLLACLGFLASGGPSRVALAALSTPGPMSAMRLVADLSAGTGVAVAVAAPVLGAAALIEVGLALVARAASPASLHAVLGSVRGVLLLVAVALFFERMAAALVLLGSAR